MRKTTYKMSALAASIHGAVSRFVDTVDWAGMWLAGIVLIVILWLYLPTAIMALQSFNGAPVATFPIKQFSLGWYEGVIRDRQMMSAFVNSLIVASATMLIATPMGTAAAWWDHP